MDPALLASRLVCMFLLLIGTFLFGCSPIYVQKTLFRCECSGGVCKKDCRARRGKMVTAFLIYFGGGVLLGTTLLHLMPEAREGFEKHPHSHPSSNDTNGTTDGDDEDDGGHHHESFPLPEFIVCLGFFAVYLFEEIVHYFLGAQSHVPTETRAVRTFSRTNSCSPPPSLNESGLTSSGKHKGPPAIDIDTIVEEEPHQGGHGHSHALPVTTAVSVGAILTVAALSFHSLFEGFAVGLQSTATGTWIVFAAIAVHKFVIAFVVGLQVFASSQRIKQVAIYMGIFALMSPLGMAIAMITDESVEESNPVTVSVLNAIATGTLLYVTFFEILQREEEKDIPTWLQLIATSAGFAVICIVQFVSTFA